MEPITSNDFLNSVLETVTPTTSNPLNSPQSRDQIAAAFMSKYGADMKEGQNLTSGYLDAVMSK